MASPEIDDVRERLRAVSEELADLALDRLRRAAAEPDPVLVAEERRVTRARRAVEKAVAVLGEPYDG